LSLLNQAYIRMILPALHNQNYAGLAHRLRNYSRLEENTLGQNRELQWEGLLRLVEHAYNTTLFYRHRLDEVGLTPRTITGPSDFARIPLLTRDDLRDRLSELQSNRFSREGLAQAATGGTTDTPVPILRSRASLPEKNAVQLSFNHWAGFLPGDKVFYLWGARQDFAQNPTWRWRLYDRYLMRQVWAPTSLFNDAVLESYRQSLNRFKPRVIYAYPTPLALFCEYLRDSKDSYHHPVTVICTAEPLLEDQRGVIEEVLGCRVFEHYGSREFAIIAGECEAHQGMHLNPAAAYVEFVPLEGAEQNGLHEIVVTDLLNYGMPLIRYRINDCALLGPETCPCGRGYPLVRQITGRTTDVFYLPNGDIVPGVALTNRVLQVCPGLKKVQIIQETSDVFRVRYVPGTSIDEEDLALLKTNLRKFIPHLVEWQFEQVSAIEREQSGKTRFCISKLHKQSVGRTWGSPGHAAAKLPACEN
jgi:phenylacetate-coenzyme A ligase PaaK-like adenylate-forming protein